MPSYYFNNLYYQIDFEYVGFIALQIITYEALIFCLYFSLVYIMGGRKELITYATNVS